MERAIAVSLLPANQPAGLDPGETCAVVIDVLRATTVMVTAAAAGATRIRTCGEIDEALRIADEAVERPLLCGERHCERIRGFDRGNSPAEYDPATVAGRELLLTTTNGTRAIRSVLDSKRLLVASFLNLRATADAISREPKLHLVCAGTNGQISYEDVLLAGALVSEIIDAELHPGQSSDRGRDSVRIDDSARIALASWRQAVASERPLSESLRQSLGGRNLSAIGFESDIDACARTDRINVVVERIEQDEPVFALA